MARSALYSASGESARGRRRQAQRGGDARQRARRIGGGDAHLQQPRIGGAGLRQPRETASPASRALSAMRSAIGRSAASSTPMLKLRAGAADGRGQRRAL